VLVVPYGTGIGDMVNLAPLVEAITAAHPAGEILVLCDPELAWLLPPGVAAIRSVHGVRSWRRLSGRGLSGRALGQLSVPFAAALLQPFATPRMSRWMTGYLSRQEFPVVINLLEMLTGLASSGDRWTRGPWQPARSHVIDLLAGELEARGIRVPVEGRAPRLEVTPATGGWEPIALVNPSSGSTLKDAPDDLWCEVLRGLSRHGFRCRVLEAPGRLIAPRLLAAASDVRAIRSTLRELVPVIAGAAVVISPDTGILHIAAATRTPYVGLFGSTDPAFSGPYSHERGEVIEAPIDHPPVCRTCWRAQLLPAARCPVFAPRNCLSAITPGRVIDAVKRVTAAPSRDPASGGPGPAEP